MKNYDLGELFSQSNLSDIDVNNPGTWPVWLRTLVAALLFSVLVFLGYKALVESEIAALDRLQAQEVDLKSIYSVKAQKVSNLPVLRAQVAELAIAFENLRTQLPNKTEVPGLLDDISDAGFSNGLTINNINLNKEGKKELYIELPISISVTGGFHDLGGYVSSVSDLSRIVTLHDFTIQPANKTGGGDLLNITLAAKTYRIHSEVDGE